MKWTFWRNQREQQVQQSSRAITPEDLGLPSTPDQGIQISRPQGNLSLALTVPALYAAMRETAEAFAALPTVILDADDNEVPQPHPGYAIIQGNTVQDQVSLRETQTLHLQGNGNSFNEIIAGFDGLPLGVYVINPNEYDVSPFLVNGIKMFRVRDKGTGQERILGEDQILHISGLSYDGIMGLSPTALGMRTIEAMALAGSSQRLYYQRGGRVPIALRTSPEFDQDPNVVAASAANVFQSPRGLGVWPNGLEQPDFLGSEQEESQRIESMNFMIREISRITNTPPTKIADVSSATYSNVQQFEQDWVRDVLQPMARRFDEVYTRRFLSPEGGLRYYTSIEPLLNAGETKPDEEAEAEMTTPPAEEEDATLPEAFARVFGT